MSNVTKVPISQKGLQKNPLHESIGYFDLKYLQEDMMDCNRKVICEKHQTYWREQYHRDLKRKLTQVCVNGDDGHKQCGWAGCECHCHHNQIHNGQFWKEGLQSHEKVSTE